MFGNSIGDLFKIFVYKDEKTWLTGHTLNQSMAGGLAKKGAMGWGGVVGPELRSRKWNVPKTKQYAGKKAMIALQ